MGVNPLVVVTGAAAYTCCGVGCQAFWNRLRAGFGSNDSTGLCLRQFAQPEMPADNNGRFEADHPLAGRLLEAIQRDLGRFLGGVTTEEKERIGVALGTAYGHLGSYFGYYTAGTERGYQFVNPRHFPFTLPNFLTVEVNNAYSLWGSSTTIGSGLAAGLEALGYAVGAIRRGEESTMLAGGLDEINDFDQHVLETGGLRSARCSVRPFAPDRDGTVPGEAVAILLLQSEESARASSREPLAELYASTTVRGVQWEVAGSRVKAAKAIHSALDDAGVQLSDIDAVFPSANGNAEGDKFERELLQEIFGSRLGSVLIFPIKSITGECFAASGALQCLAAVYAVGLAPERPVPAIRKGTELFLAEHIVRQTTALVYSAGYDGSFSTLVVRRPTA